jgi:GntR family transcriptional regulator
MTPRDPKRLIIPPLSPAAPEALYRQIAEGIKREVGAGRLRAGEALPSFRVLAGDLLVSLITVKRAYEELEREGIIFRKQGLGTFVADDGAENSRQAKRDEATALLRRGAEEAAQAGMDEDEIAELVRRMVRKTRRKGRGTR